MQKNHTDIFNFPGAKASAVAPASQKPGGKVATNTYNSNNLAAVPKPQSENCPFRRLVKEWLEAGRAAGLSPKTIEDYQGNVKDSLQLGRCLIQLQPSLQEPMPRGGRRPSYSKVAKAQPGDGGGTERSSLRC